jgi:signal transduction histidine kinase
MRLDQFKFQRLDQRIGLLTFATTLVTLLAAVAVLTWVQYRAALASARDEQRILVQALADAGAAAAAFDDHSAAREITAALGRDDDVISVIFSSRESGELARFQRPNVGVALPAERIEVPLRLGEREVGSLICESNYSRIAENLRAVYLRLAPIVIILGAVLAWGVALVVRQRVAGPFLRLADFAHQVAARQDYTARAPQVADATPETAAFTAAFNAMLARIQEQEGALRASARQLGTQLQELERTLRDNQRMADERLAFERSLQDTQRLESLGILAGGIAHDFNNLLTVVTAHASLGQEITRGTEAYDSFTQIAAAAKRAAELCRQMLAYAGRGKVQEEDIDLSRFIREGSALLAVSAGKAQLALELPSGLPALRADPAQLQQIVMNLVINAAEAMPTPGGRIELRVDTVKLDTLALANMRMGSAATAGQFVRLTVRDQGSGMSSEVQQRLFDPFFTTKFTGRGLGLSAVLGIVKLHHGALDLRSALGAGTCFEICFPALNRVAAATAVAAPLRAPRFFGRALLVDDDPMVRGSCRGMITRLGFTVVEAVDGQDGVEKFAAQGPFTFVLMDLTMPRLGGLEATEAILAQAPSTRIVLMTGYAADASFHDADRTRFAGALQKPFDIETAARLLAQILPAETAPPVVV